MNQYIQKYLPFLLRPLKKKSGSCQMQKLVVMETGAPIMTLCMSCVEWVEVWLQQLKLLCA